MSTITTESGLTIEDTVIGEGAAAAAGREVIVHYAGWLADGTQFDSSKEKQDPFQFTLGKKEVMAGWEEGLRGMKVGGTRKLTVPPQLATAKTAPATPSRRTRRSPSKWSCSRFPEAPSSRAGKSSGRQDAKVRDARREIQ